jgi:hypothetical protein
VQVDDVQCVDAGLEMPATVRECNRFPCPRQLYTWDVGGWQACVSQSGCGTGLSSRSVVCTDGTGAVTSDDVCVAQVADVLQPAVSEQCDTGVSCGCATVDDCLSTQFECVDAQCVCAPGWQGADCTYRPPTATAGEEPCEGVMDGAGECCTGVLDSITGLCCGAGAAVDKRGRCCEPPAVVDGCGECGGGGVAVDVQGKCCASELPPSGVCCQAASGVDSCGVCGGVNNCKASVVLRLTASDSSQLQDTLTEGSIEDALGMDDGSITDVTATLMDDSSVSGCVRACVCGCL